MTLSSLYPRSLYLLALGFAMLCRPHTTAVHAQSCSPQAQSAAALSPPGGLNLSTTQSLTPKTLFMAVLADFAYTKELGLLSTPRQPIGPCLKSWGAEGDPVVIDSKDSAGGVSHCTLFRTKYDIFLLFRGLDDVANIKPIVDDVGRAAAADYLGVPAAAADRAKVWLLRGYFRAHRAMEPLYMEEVNKLVQQLAPEQQATYRVWIAGHSDGAAHAQMAAPRLIQNLGQTHLGGVFLFGPQRVGSAAFAKYYNSIAGNQTLRYQYGWDPAMEQLFLASSGLRIVGNGFTACPVKNKAKERVVRLKLGVDRPYVCGKPPAAAAAADSGSSSSSSSGIGTDEAAVAQYGRRRLPLAEQTSAAANVPAVDPQQLSLTELDYLPHHLFSVIYDSLLRQLGKSVDRCSLAALQLPQCIVSSKCSAALRPDPRVSGKCATCATNATCSQAWGGAAGDKCDSASAKSSGNLCYNVTPPGLYFGMLGWVFG